MGLGFTNPIGVSNSSQSTGTINNVREIFFQPIVNFGTPPINDQPLPSNNTAQPDFLSLVSELKANPVDVSQLTGSVVNASTNKPSDNKMLYIVAGLAVVAYFILR